MSYMHNKFLVFTYDIWSDGQGNSYLGLKFVLHYPGNNFLTNITLGTIPFNE